MISQAMAFGLMFGIAGIAKEFVPVFFGDGFDPCEALIPLLAVIIPVCAWSSVLGNQYLIPHERDTQYLVSVLVGSLVDIILCILLVLRFGAFGAAIATVAAELSVSLVQSIMLRKELPLGHYLLDAIPFAVIGVIEFFVVRLIGMAMSDTLFGISAQVISGAMTYLAASYVWLRTTHDERLELVLPGGIKK